MRESKSFTLMEMLVASSIFAVVALTIYSAFHTGLYGSKNIRKNIEISQSARQILQRLNLDLRNAFGYSKNESKFKGSKNGISFLTLVDSYRKYRIVVDCALVVYRLKKNRLFRLCRKNLQILDTTPKVEEELMTDNEVEVLFGYSHINPKTKEVEFKDSWLSEETLPHQVKIKLVISDNKEKINKKFERTIFIPLGG